MHCDPEQNQEAWKIPDQLDNISRKPFHTWQISKEIPVIGTLEISEILCSVLLAPVGDKVPECWEGAIPGWEAQRAVNVLVRGSQTLLGPREPCRKIVFNLP